MCNKLHAEGFMPVTSKTGLKLFAKDETGRLLQWGFELPYVGDGVVMWQNIPTPQGEDGDGFCYFTYADDVPKVFFSPMTNILKCNAPARYAKCETVLRKIDVVEPLGSFMEQGFISGGPWRMALCRGFVVHLEEGDSI